MLGGERTSYNQAIYQKAVFFLGKLLCSAERGGGEGSQHIGLGTYSKLDTQEPRRQGRSLHEGRDPGSEGCIGHFKQRTVISC